MQVELAGFNFDFQQIKNYYNYLKNNNKVKSIKEFNNIKFTPETISAAYARISRSAKSIKELRKIALKDVEKARNSNKNIIFDMGHSSIAEHAVFNFDIIGISRYLMEFVQRSRLASYTEKSQRYVTLKGDFVLPPEINNDDNLKNKFIEIINLQNDTYLNIYNCLMAYYLSQSKYKSLKKNILKNKAQEDARYILSLATKTQMGMTINARSMERLIKRLRSIDLLESYELADKLYSTTKKLSPSLIKYTNPSEYDKNLYETISKNVVKNQDIKNKLLDYTKNSDEKIMASIIFRKKGIDYDDIGKELSQMKKDEKLKILHENLVNIACYDSLPREFELANFTFQLNISSSCFAQLKRHRMASLVSSDYDPIYGYTIPESVEKIGKSSNFRNVLEKTQKLYKSLRDEIPAIKNYILTNSNHKLVIFQMNLRELGNFARLREDKHAQWEIRNIAHYIVQSCRKVAPLTTSLICGKDNFKEFYQKFMNK